MILIGIKVIPIFIIYEPGELVNRAKPWSDAEYCAFRGISKGASAQERYKGVGPRFIKAGKRVFYDPTDVYDWLDANKVSRTDGRPGAA